MDHRLPGWLLVENPKKIHVLVCSHRRIVIKMTKRRFSYSYILILPPFPVFFDTCHNSVCLRLPLDLPFVTELSTLIKHISCVKKIPRRLGQRQTRWFSILKLPQFLIENTIVLASNCV